MSEPIRLFNADGDEIALFAPFYAAEMVAAGEVFLQPPAAATTATDESAELVIATVLPLSSVYDIDSMTVAQLKELAKESGIAGYSRMNREQLIEVLTNDGAI